MGFALKAHNLKTEILPNKPAKFKRVTLGSYTITSGTKTYNIKTSYPDIYADLTNNNFFYNITAIATKSTSAYTYAQTGSSSLVSAYSCTSTPTISYNASTGVLSCGRNLNHIDLKNNGTGVESLNWGGTVTVYMAYAYE